MVSRFVPPVPRSHLGPEHPGNLGLANPLKPVLSAHTNRIGALCAVVLT